MGQLTLPTAIMPLPVHETAQLSSEERERASMSDKDRDKDKGGRSRTTSKERSSRKSSYSSSSTSKSKENVSFKDDRLQVDAKEKDGLSVGHRIFWPRAKLGRPRSKTSPSEKPNPPPPPSPPPLPNHPEQSKSVTSLPPPPATHTSNALARDRDKEKPPPLQDRTRSFLERLNSSIGDAQASPPHKQSSADDSPIDTAVRRIQETGYSARALLARIHQNRIAKDVVRDFVFLTCVDTFKRDPLDNIDELSSAYQLFSTLVQEGIVPGHDFVRAAQQLREEGHPDGCRLLLRLISSDTRLSVTQMLTPNDQRMIANLARTDH